MGDLQEVLTAAHIGTLIVLVHTFMWSVDSTGSADTRAFAFIVTVGILAAVPAWSESNDIALGVCVGLNWVALATASAHRLKYTVPLTALSVGLSSITLLIAGIVTGNPGWPVATVSVVAVLISALSYPVSSTSDTADALQASASSFL